MHFFSPDSVQRCWNFTMGSVLARLFRPHPLEVWIRLSKPVLDTYFQSVQLSEEDLIHQAALANFHFEGDPTLPPEAQLDFVANSSCIYFSQQERSLLTLWRRTLRILEEEGERVQSHV